MVKLPFHFLVTALVDVRPDAGRLAASVTAIGCLALLWMLVWGWRRRECPFPRATWLFGGLLAVSGGAHLLEGGGWVSSAYPNVLFLKLGNVLAFWVGLVGWGWILLRAPAARRPGEGKWKAAERQRPAPSTSLSGERMRLLVDHFKDYAIFVLDLDGRVRSWNDGAQKVLGYRAAEIIGQSCSCFYPKEDQQRGEARTAWKTAASEGRIEEEGWRIRADGSRFWAHVTVTALKDEEGRLSGFSCVIRDITARQHVKDQLYQAQKMEAVGRLAGGVAHDFNNLLTVITGYTELLLGQAPAEEPAAGSLREILKAGQRAASLTQQLLIFSRKQLVAPRVLDPNAIVADMEKLLIRLIGEDIELRTSLDPNLGRVEADPGQLSQVIMNLAVNARDAMPRGGRLVIKTSNEEVGPGGALAPGAYVVLTITDTGCGMEEAVQAHLFEPFFTTKEPGKGTGLGLATVYGIIKQGGGHIDVVSSPGSGSTFKVCLPRLAQVPTEDFPQGGSTQARDGSETILLVEDETALRNLARLVLDRHGYKVLEATNGRHALHIAKQHEGPIELLVSDVVMPLMGGQELAKKLGSLRPEMRVLFMSGYTDSAVVRSGVYAGEMVLLQKPFSPDQLASKVREMLDAPVLEGAH